MVMGVGEVVFPIPPPGPSSATGGYGGERVPPSPPLEPPHDVSLNAGWGSVAN